MAVLGCLHERNSALSHVTVAPAAYIGIRFRRVKRWLVAPLALALLLWGPSGAALATVLPTDRIGQVAVGATRLTEKSPNLNMAAGALIMSDGRILWSRAEARRRAIASITKIMTAVVVLDRLSLDDVLTVPRAALEIGESDAHLRVGEKLTVQEALEAMLVKSGNDAALSLALRTSKDENDFVDLMNAKAAALGMSHTRFANSYGLDEPGHYSSAADVAVLGRFAMTYPVFRDIVRRKAVVIGRGADRHRLETSNLLLSTYRGANGIKTGWTGDAGYSVVASARRGGEELIAVVLGTASDGARFQEAASLLNWGFTHTRQVSIVSSGTVIGASQVSDYDDRYVPVLASRAATATVFDVDGTVRRTPLFDVRVKAPVAQGQTLGVLVVTQGDRLLTTVPLVAGASVPAPRFFERIGITLHRWWNSIFG